MKVMPLKIYTSGFQTWLHVALINKAVKTLPTKMCFIKSYPEWVSFWSYMIDLSIDLSAIEVSGAESPLSLVADTLLTSCGLGTGAGAASWLGQSQRARRAGLTAPAPPEGQQKDDHANAISSHRCHELTSAGSAGPL